MNCNQWLQRSRRATSAVFAFGLCFSAVSALAQSASTVPGRSSSPGGTPSGSFIAAPSIYLGYASSSVATGDLRSSGKLDLVTANPAAGTVVVFLGEGTGKFSTGISYAAGKEPVAVAIANVTGDGREDLIVANGSGNTISLLAGRGDGTFAAPVAYKVGFSPSMLVTGDFSGKGTQEVVAASASGTQLAVFLSDGNGGLGAPRMYSLASVPAAITASDLNHDGHIDLALANADGTVTPLLNDGTGRFRELSEIPVASGPLSSIAVADLNHDGIVDLAVTESGSRKVSVLLGKGDGTFESASSYAVGAEPVAVQIADVDGDGIADLVVVNKSSNTFSVLTGSGDGTFKTAQHFVVGNNPAGAVLGDFYSSGHIDLASVNLLSKSISIPQNNGDGAFQASRSYVTGEQPVAIASGDLTGAGHADLAVANYCGSDLACKEPGSVAILLADSTGTYRLASVYPVGTGPVALVLRDLNGDGKLDLIALNRADKTMTLRLGEGDGAFGQAMTFSLSGAPVALASGSFTAGGNTDLAILEDCGEAKCSSPGSVEILHGDGAGNFHSISSLAAGYSPVSIAAGALTPKGNTDIVVLNRCGSDASCQSAGAATILRGDGAGNFTAVKPVTVGTNPGALALGALTGAGTLDLVVSRTGSNSLAVLHGNGDGTFQSPVAYAAGSAPGALLIGDFNGDGVADVAVANASDSTISVLYGKGDGTLQTATNFPVGAHPSAMTALNSKGSTQAGIATANGSTSNAVQGSEVTALLKAVPMNALPSLTSFTLSMSSNNVAFNQGTSVTVVAVGDSQDGPPPGTVTVIAENSSQTTTITLCSNLSPSSPSGDIVTYTCGTSSTDTLPAGTWNISATYTDGSVYENITSGAAASNNPLAVTPIAATLGFSKVPSTAVGINTSASFTVTLTATPTTPVAPAGTVTLMQGSTSLCSVALVAGTSYTATCATNLLSGPSPATVTASYSDTNGNYTVATPASTSVTLTPITTSLNLTHTGSGGATVDTPYTLEAIVEGSPVTPYAPTGTVSFTANGSGIPGCSGTSPSKVQQSGTQYIASCTTSYLTAPSASILATYSGDANFAGFAATTPLVVSVLKATPTYTLTATPQAPNASITVNVPVVFTIALTSPASTAPTQPTGTITVTQGSTLCTITLPATSCTYTSGFASATTVTVHSSYGGDTQFNSVSSGGSASVTVGPTGTSTTVSGPSTANVNTAVSFTAQVTADVTGATVPAGTVSFTVTNSSSTTTTVCPNVTLPSSGTAMCSYAFPASGNYTVNAAYTPNPANFIGSSSKTGQQITIGPSAVGITVSLDSTSVNPSAINQKVIFDSQLTFPTGSATPSGQGDTVVYSDISTTPATMLCTVAVNASTSPYTPPSCPVYTLSQGSHKITAAFVPGPTDKNFSGQTSSPISQTVNPDPTTFTVSSSSPTLIVNQPFTLTATLTPTFIYTGAGGRSPVGGTVSFSASTTSPTTNPANPTILCSNNPSVTNTGTAASPVYQAICTPAAGSLGASATPYTITATYMDAATPPNFVTGTTPAIATTPITIGIDRTAAVTPTASAASIQVNALETITATVKSTYPGSIVPTGSVQIWYSSTGSNPTALCTVTIVGGSASCPVPYQDMQVKTSPYTFTATYTPDAAGSVNFLNPTNSTTSATVAVTPATTSVQLVPTVSAGAPGYASQTITYTATVTSTPPFPTGSSSPGVSPTGTITLSSGAGSAGIAIVSACTPVTLPANASFPISALCTVQYPLNYTASNNTDNVTVSYVSGDNNYNGLNTPSVEPVRNFSLSYTSSTARTLFISPGNTNTDDPVFPNQTLASLAASTASTGPGVLTDSLAYSCTVTSASGATSNLPTCAAVPSSAAPSTTPVAYTVTVPSGAAGQYTVTVSAGDPNASTLIHTQTTPLIVYTPSQTPYSFSGVYAQPGTVNFGAPSTFTPTAAWCPQMLQTSGTPPPGVTGWFVNQGTLNSPGTSQPTYLTCALGNSPSTGTTLAINITPIEATQAAANKGDQKSNRSYAAAVLAMPVLVFFGWFGRNRARKSFFRMMTVLLLAWSALSISGCGGGFKLTTPGSSSAPTVLPQGNYQVMVAAQDASNNTYYAIVTVTVN